MNNFFYVKVKYLKPFNFVQIELLELDRNTWTHLTVCQQ